MHGESVHRLPGAAAAVRPSVQRAASGLFLVTRTVADGLRLFLTALLLQYVGWGIGPAIVVVGVVTIVYTYLGGMKAVIWTDLIQFVIKIAGAVLAAVFVLQLLPGGWDQFRRKGHAAGKFKLIESSFERDGSLTSSGPGVIGGAVFSMASHGADQLMVQRYLLRPVARPGPAGAGPQRLHRPRAVPALPRRSASGCDLLATGAASSRRRTGEPRNDEVFGLFIVTQLPTGVVGVLVAAVLAAAMSTLSSSLNSSANAVRDRLLPAAATAPFGEVVRAPVASDDGRVGRGPDGCGLRCVPAGRRQERGRDRCWRSPASRPGCCWGCSFSAACGRPVRRGGARRAGVRLSAVLAVWLPRPG